MTANKTYFLAACMTALLGACSSTPVAPPATAHAMPVSTPPVAAAPARPATPAPVVAARPPTSSPVTTVTIPAYLDPRSEISVGRSAYFDFDRAELKPEYTGLIERHGKYLLANPGLAIRVEGNTDERGSREYNLALGQKRAEAMRQALKLAGVPVVRMEAVSWGEERPKASGNDESAWAQNRRADIQYPAR